MGWQRHAWKAGRLRPERQRALAALGFCANAHEEAWSARFAQLAAFHSEHGHCDVPRTAERRREEAGAAAPAAGPAAVAAARKGQRQQQLQQQEGRYPGLHQWLQRQRVQWGSGTLPDERRRRLEGLGVQFQVQRSAWEARYAELAAFREVSAAVGG